MELVNMTGHPITLRAVDGVVEIPPSGVVVRQRSHFVHEELADSQLGRVRFVDEEVGDVEHLPAPTTGRYLIVSRPIALLHLDRSDLVVPVQQERNTAGEVSAGALARLLMRTASSAGQVLVVLCGSNPLPNLLAVLVRRPDRAVLLHSPETKAAAVRLRAGIRVILPATVVELLAVDSATDGASIRSALAALPAGWGLDYSGGTKAMAALSRLACATPHDPADERCSYIDHRADLVRFDDGSSVPLDAPGLTIESLALLHGSTLERDPQRFRPDHRWIADAGAALVAAARQFGSVERKAAYAEELNRRVRSLPSSSWGDEIRARPGLWLEWYVQYLVHRALGEGLVENDICVGATLRPTGADDVAELDVVVRQDWLISLLSCDTSMVAKWSAHHKTKAMEATFRARQLGGDASHPALVTLLTAEGTKGVARHLGSNSVGVAPRVFGVEDLHRWGSGDLADLRLFLVGR